MKTILSIFIFLAGVSFSATPAFAHGLMKMPQTAREGNIAVSLETDPDFPVVGRVTHLDIILKDAESHTPVSSVAVSLRISRKDGGESFSLPAILETPGHYGSSYSFPEKGKWSVRVFLDGESVSKEFIIDVDGLAPRGWLRIGTIFFLAILLIVIARRDCIPKSRRFAKLLGI